MGSKVIDGVHTSAAAGTKRLVSLTGLRSQMQLHGLLSEQQEQLTSLVCECIPPGSAFFFLVKNGQRGIGT
jgi:hypothetical protein